MDELLLESNLGNIPIINFLSSWFFDGENSNDLWWLEIPIKKLKIKKFLQFSWLFWRKNLHVE